jgi:membrane dipeptidase
MRLSWNHLGTPRADNADGKTVEITGWPTTSLPVESADYFLLTNEPGCCAGCVPGNPLAVIEVFADGAIDLAAGAVRLCGTLHVATDDPASWRYQLRHARQKSGLLRRTLLVASPLACLPIPALADVPAGTVDMHSHAGKVIFLAQNPNASFVDMAEPMRRGGMATVCLAIVADTPTTTRDPEGRIRPYRTPVAGELYAHSKLAFARLHQLVREQGLTIVRDRAGLAAARAERPSIIVSSEGADWTDGLADRVDEAYEKWQLRHLQLTHYRPNELGDIQTEPPVNGGLTAAGVEVIRRCNKLGVVVDVAHGTYELVKKAAAVTTKPLILSHTSLSDRQTLWTRQITSDHARALASTGGVIGVWPNKGYFAGMTAHADGIARMVDVVGIDHVGLGTDQLGLPAGSTMPSYVDLPRLVAALSGRFTVEETAKLLGGNYRRVFEVSIS